MTFRKGLRDGLPIGLGYLSVSFAFGMMAVRAGFTVAQAVFISATNVTSAGQFAGLTLISAGASMYELGLTQFVINLRYALMSLSLSQKLDNSMTTLHRMLFAFCNTDEVFAVASGQKGLVGRRYLYGLITLPIAGWVLGTLLGAAAGTLLPELIINALGVAIYGMFIAIVIPPAKNDRAVRVAAVAAAALSCVLYYAPGLKNISSGFSIIICAVAVSAFCAWRFPIRVDEKEDAAP
ncbi:MAG: AzlC family ABC transporter permease [Clostridia bacterium]|nr:AzlC family ABC transporter permease [Clostridia bacterium]